MNKLIALCYFVLSLFGCDGGGNTIVHRTSVDGSDALYSRARVQAGVARFECLRSASGQCHYAVFPRVCVPAPPAGDEHDANCLQGRAERFALATGESRQVTGLHGFRLCVSVERGTADPDCEPLK